MAKQLIIHGCRFRERVKEKPSERIAAIHRELTKDVSPDFSKSMYYAEIRRKTTKDATSDFAKSMYFIEAIIRYLDEEHGFLKTKENE